MVNIRLTACGSPAGSTLSPLLMRCYAKQHFLNILFQQSVKTLPSKVSVECNTRYIFISSLGKMFSTSWLLRAQKYERNIICAVFFFFFFNLVENNGMSVSFQINTSWEKECWCHTDVLCTESSLTFVSIITNELGWCTWLQFYNLVLHRCIITRISYLFRCFYVPQRILWQKYRTVTKESCYTFL